MSLQILFGVISQSGRVKFWRYDQLWSAMIDLRVVSALQYSAAGQQLASRWVFQLAPALVQNLKTAEHFLFVQILFVQI